MLNYGDLDSKQTYTQALSITFNGLIFQNNFLIFDKALDTSEKQLLNQSDDHSNGRGITKLKARLEALEKVHKTLEEFSHEDLNANMPKAAFIKAFEYTYELSWKSMKSAAELKGLDSKSPRDAIRNGLKLNIISDEPSVALHSKGQKHHGTHLLS